MEVHHNNSTEVHHSSNTEEVRHNRVMDSHLQASMVVHLPQDNIDLQVSLATVDHHLVDNLVIPVDRHKVSRAMGDHHSKATVGHLEGKQGEEGHPEVDILANNNILLRGGRPY